jgi:hypothetical protein
MIKEGECAETQPPAHPSLVTRVLERKAEIEAELAALPAGDRACLPLERALSQIAGLLVGNPDPDHFPRSAAHDLSVWLEANKNIAQHRS